MEIIINTASETPVYEQIVLAVEKAVQNADLPAGSILPTIRQLAADLEVNANTVAKSYKILEAKHIIKSAGRKGTFVQESAAIQFKKNIEDEVTHAMSNLLTHLANRGASKSLIEKAFRRIIGQWE